MGATKCRACAGRRRSNYLTPLITLSVKNPSELPNSQLTLLGPASIWAQIIASPPGAYYLSTTEQTIR